MEAIHKRAGGGGWILGRCIVYQPRAGGLFFLAYREKRDKTCARVGIVQTRFAGLLQIENYKGLEMAIFGLIMLAECVPAGLVHVQTRADIIYVFHITLPPKVRMFYTELRNLPESFHGMFYFALHRIQIQSVSLTRA